MSLPAADPSSGKINRLIPPCGWRALSGKKHKICPAPHPAPGAAKLKRF
jgi:hypothetical protein